MKKLFSLLAIIVLVAVSNCTQIPENNDPILGIWLKTPTEQSKTAETQKENWIFNDAYLGRYQRFVSGQLSFETDFRWSNDDGIYTIFYGVEGMPEIIVELNQSGSPEQLEETTGAIFAIRE